MLGKMKVAGELTRKEPAANCNAGGKKPRLRQSEEGKGTI